MDNWLDRQRRWHEESVALCKAGRSEQAPSEPEPVHYWHRWRLRCEAWAFAQSCTAAFKILFPWSRVADMEVRVYMTEVVYGCSTDDAERIYNPRGSIRVYYTGKASNGEARWQPAPGSYLYHHLGDALLDAITARDFDQMLTLLQQIVGDENHARLRWA